MKHAILATGLLLIFFFSCTPSDKDFNTKKIPKGIIPPDTMVIIITDLQLAEATLRELKRQGKETAENEIELIGQVFAKNQTPRKRYQESLAFYQQHLELYEKIYDQVIERLSVLQTKIVNGPEK